MLNINKRGNSPGTMAGLIFLIIIFLVVYVLILPPCDKCELLNLECSTDCEVSSGSVDGSVILSESPGMVTTFGLDESIKELDQVNLFFDSRPYTKRLDTSINIGTSWFSDSDKLLSFDVEDLDNVETSSLLVDVSSSRGDLMIELNGNLIFSEKIKGSDLEIIELPVAYLKDKNSLRMYVNSPGLAFWSKNYYNINDVIFKIEFNKVSAKAVRDFYVSSVEKDNLLGSRLEFFVYCGEEIEGFTLFKVFLNDKLINNELLDCEGQDKIIVLDRDDIESGANKVTFVIDSGKFILSEVELINSFVSNIHPSYYFDVSNDVYIDSSKINLKLEFGNGGKRGEIKINDNIFELDTSDDEFEIDILNYIKKGENFIEIIPDVNFEIKKLKIWYE